MYCLTITFSSSFEPSAILWSRRRKWYFLLRDSSWYSVWRSVRKLARTYLLGRFCKQLNNWQLFRACVKTFGQPLANLGNLTNSEKNKAFLWFNARSKILFSVRCPWQRNSAPCGWEYSQGKIPVLTPSIKTYLCLCVFICNFIWRLGDVGSLLISAMFILNYTRLPDRDYTQVGVA